MTRYTRIGLVLLLLCPATAWTQSPLDHIPGDAIGALVIRNTTELAKKGDKLIDDAKLDLPFRITQMLPLVYAALNLPANEIDESRPIAIVVGNPKLVDPKRNPQELMDKCLVVGFPFKDQDNIEKAFGLEAGILKGGQAVKVPKKMGVIGEQLPLIAMQGKHFYLGSHPKVVEAVAKSKGIGGELSATQRKQLAQADVVLHLGTEAWGDVWKEGLRDLARNLEAGTDEAGKKQAKEFVAALREVKFGLAALRIDDGIGLNVLSVFPKDGGEAAKKFLMAMRGGDGPSSLRWLPEGNVIAATAAKGDGSQNGSIARVFLRSLVEDFLVPKRILGAADRPALLSIFSEIWQRLRGTRLALYKTADASELGLFSVVGILETEDPQKFLAELRQLAKFGNPDGLDFITDVAKKANEEEIEQLIKDLGHRRFVVRESAAVKLALAGEPVLPYLEKAMKSSDLEVKRTAERIKGEIVQAIKDRREEALSGNLARTIKPSFVFLDKKEKVEGFDVQSVGVKLTKKDAATVPALKAILGPDWNRIRLAVHGKQVVVLIGTDLGLYQKVLRNLKDDKAGLAGLKVFEGQSKQTDLKRKIELHASAQMIYTLASAQDLEKPAKVPPTGSLTSLTLSVEPDRFQVDFWMPVAEIRAINEASKK